MPTKHVETFGDFQEVIAANPQVLIDLDGSTNLSLLRDGPYDQSNNTIGHTAGSGSITDDPSEFKLSITGSSGDEAMLRTAARGRYQPGKSSVAGIGIRTGSDSVTGDTEALWGYFDLQNDAVSPNNGFGWGLDSTGLFLTRWEGGTAKACNEAGDTRVYQSDWSEEPNFLSDRNINLSDGNIFQVRYTYYGYGLIRWQIVFAEPNHDVQTAVTVHTHKVDGNTSTNNPNVNVTGLAKNPSGDSSLDLFIGGRQYTVLGSYNPQVRTTGDTRQSFTVDTTASGEYDPLLSFRRQSGREEVAVQALGADMITNQDVEFAIYIGAELSGSNFGSIDGVQDSETAFEVDKSSTNISTGTGVRIRPTLFKGGEKNKEEAAGAIDQVLTDIPDGLPVSFCARALSATSASVTLTGRMIEEW